MERKTITIEQIIENPNLDLSERINKLSQDKRWSKEDLKELAIASIKQEYEFWLNERKNVSAQTDELLKKILDGHFLSKIEGFEMMCDDPEKVELYSKYESLKKRIKDNNGITLEDFYELCQVIGIDSEFIELIRHGLERKGLIIDSYMEEESYQK